jgi:hypothetical protein
MSKYNTVLSNALATVLNNVTAPETGFLNSATALRVVVTLDWNTLSKADDEASRLRRGSLARRDQIRKLLSSGPLVFQTTDNGTLGLTTDDGEVVVEVTSEGVSTDISEFKFSEYANSLSELATMALQMLEVDARNEADNLQTVRNLLYNLMKFIEG